MHFYAFLEMEYKVKFKTGICNESAAKPQIETLPFITLWSPCAPTKSHWYFENGTEISLRRNHVGHIILKLHVREQYCEAIMWLLSIFWIFSPHQWLSHVENTTSAVSPALHTVGVPPLLWAMELTKGNPLQQMSRWWWEVRHLDKSSCRGGIESPVRASQEYGERTHNSGGRRMKTKHSQ